MSTNKFQPHVLVIPEDDANRQIANGFVLHPQLKQRYIDIQPCAGGWLKVHAHFLAQHLPALRKYPHRHLILLIDFDDSVDRRIDYFQKDFAEDIQKRVYLLGSKGEPEELRKANGLSLEQIGLQLANECAANYPAEAGNTLWQSELLKHNQAELQRLKQNVRPFLFQP